MRETIIRLNIEPLEEGGYLATSPDVPGLIVQGRTIVETSKYAQGLTLKLIECCLDHGDPIPPALTRGIGTGPWELRIPVTTA